MFANMATHIRNEPFCADKPLNSNPTNTALYWFPKTNEGVVFFLTNFEFQLDNFMLESEGGADSKEHIDT